MEEEAVQVAMGGHGVGEGQEGIWVTPPPSISELRDLQTLAFWDRSCPPVGRGTQCQKRPSGLGLFPSPMHPSTLRPSTSKTASPGHFRFRWTPA